jgi:hypothetical protein
MVEEMGRNDISQTDLPLTEATKVQRDIEPISNRKCDVRKERINGRWKSLPRFRDKRIHHRWIINLIYDGDWHVLFASDFRFAIQ